MTATQSYYFDGHDGISDPNSAWSNESYLGNYNYTDSDFAQGTTAGSTASNYILVQGTMCGVTGPDITQVRVRLRAYADSNKTVSATVYTDGLGEELGTATVFNAGPATGSWTTLTAPAGGWTWATLHALECKAYSNGTFQRVYWVELEVTVDATLGNFYFDASDEGPTDPDNHWFDEANIVDGNINTLGYPNAAGTKTSNYVAAGGTGASGSDTVLQVRARSKGLAGSNDSLRVTIYTDGEAEELGTVICTGNATSPWFALTQPSGGWSWATSAALQFRGYADASATSFYFAEIEVASDGVPVGVGQPTMLRGTNVPGLRQWQPGSR